jgi:hypothetical protein
MPSRVVYDDVVMLECTENSQKIEAEILDYRPGHMITCSVNRQVKVFLRYNQGNKNYVGNVGALEFVTNGPAEAVVKQGR